MTESTKEDEYLSQVRNECGPPDYGYYKTRPAWKLRDACLIFHGIEPRAFQRLFVAVAPPKPIRDMLGLAAESAVVTPQILPATKAGAYWDQWWVKPCDFLQWAAGKGYAVPPELQSLAAAPATNEPPPAKAVPDTWLTVTQAAQRLVDNLDGTIAFENAKPMISKACTAGKIHNNGKEGKQRRVDRVSLDAWILERRNVDLERQERETRDARSEPPPAKRCATLADTTKRR